MPHKIRIAVLLGGRSAEHEVSLQSAKNVIEAIDRARYSVVPIGIDKTGSWFLCKENDFLENPDDPRRIRLKINKNERLAILPGMGGHAFVRSTDGKSIGPIDVVFPVLHGPLGEDGTLQGLLKIVDMPFVGAGVLGSSVGMDKVVMKRLLMNSGVPVARYLAAWWHEKKDLDFERISRDLGLPLFVKPANLGSSVGVGKVSDSRGFEKAVADAFRFDNKILIEEFISGREIECSVLGNEDPVASVAGEILPRHDFYSYEAKYIDEDGAGLEIPAQLAPGTLGRVQSLSIEAYKALQCEGMARVDGFLKADDDFVINEINTIPGFTRISMYPKLWDASGIPYPELIHRLIQLAIDRHDREKMLETDCNLDP